MNNLERYDITLNIRYDLPEEVLAKTPWIYQQLPGWIGFGEDQLPYWYSNDEDAKMIYASVEPGGLQLIAHMESAEWFSWLAQFKELATEVLGFPVGDVTDGFC